MYKFLFRKIFLSSFIILLSLSSCTKDNYKIETIDGVKITTNKNVGQNQKLGLKLTKICTINGDTDSLRYIKRIGRVDFDNENNIYIVDRGQMRIKKYEPTGKFLKDIGREGIGPGEFGDLRFITIQNDTIFAPDFYDLNLEKYNLNGDFYSGKRYDSYKESPGYPAKIKNNYIDDAKATVTEVRNGENYFLTTHTINLYDDKFNYLKKIKEVEKRTNKNTTMNPSNFLMAIINSDEYIYLATKRAERYQIDVLDLEGNVKRIIKKNYKKEKLSDIEKEEIVEQGKRYNLNYKADYREALTTLKIDKLNRLWVKRPNYENRFHLYDIFENDIFQKMLDLDFPEHSTLTFIKDKLVEINNENKIINIYEYTF